MSIPLDKFWGRNFYNNPPLEKAAVAEAESLLGVKLPIEYLELLEVQNGGYTQGFAFPVNSPTSWACDHVPLKELAGIVHDPAHVGVHNIMLSQYLIKEWGLPEGQVLLSGDGHWWISLDFRGPAEPCVRWIDCEVGEDLVISSSFSDFLRGLVPESRFEEDA